MVLSKAIPLLMHRPCCLDKVEKASLKNHQRLSEFQLFDEIALS